MMRPTLTNIRDFERRINYEKVFVHAGIALHAIGLAFMLAMFAAYTELSGIAETWAKSPVFGIYIFTAFFGADGVTSGKPARFAWATITNFIIIFTF